MIRAKSRKALHSYLLLAKIDPFTAPRVLIQTACGTLQVVLFVKGLV